MQIDQLRAQISKQKAAEQEDDDLVDAIVAASQKAQDLPTNIRDAMIETENDLSEALDIITEFVDEIEPILDKDMKGHFLSMNQRIDLVDLKLKAQAFLDQWEWEGE